MRYCFFSLSRGKMYEKGKIKWKTHCLERIQERVLHVVVSMNDDWVFFITAYYPDIIKFEKDLKTRRER